MRLLCWLGIHRWYWQFVGSSWQPNDYVRACWWCGHEWPGTWKHPNHKPSEPCTGGIMTIGLCRHVTAEKMCQRSRDHDGEHVLVNRTINAEDRFHQIAAQFPVDPDAAALATAWGEGYAAGQDSLSGPTGEYVDDPRLKNPYVPVHLNGGRA